MKSWLTSLNGAITLSVAALLTQLWRAFIDFQYEYAQVITDIGPLAFTALLYTAFFAGWAWALVRAARGSRGGLMAALVISLLFLLAIPVGTLVAYCPSPCQELWPLMELSNWTSLLFGVLSAAALVLQLRQPKTVSETRFSDI